MASDQPTYVSQEMLTAMLSAYKPAQLSRMILQAMTFGNQSPTPLATELMNLIVRMMSNLGTVERTRFISHLRDIADELERPDLAATKTTR